MSANKKWLNHSNKFLTSCHTYQFSFIVQFFHKICLRFIETSMHIAKGCHKWILLTLININVAIIQLSAALQTIPIVIENRENTQHDLLLTSVATKSAISFKSSLLRFEMHFSVCRLVDSSVGVKF